MTIGNSLRFKIFARDGFTCMYCGAQPPNVLLEVDHILAQAKGGSDDPFNLVTACADCNRAKRAHDISDALTLHMILRENSRRFNENAFAAVGDADSIEGLLEDMMPMWGNL